MANETTIAGVIILLVILVVAAYYLMGMSATTSTTTSPYGSTTSPNQRTSQVPVLMTDPPSMPAGTTAYVITYSNVSLYKTSPNGSGWVNAQGSGTVNLMNLNTTAQVIGYANAYSNTSISAVQYQINSATITVNGTTYNVANASALLTAQVSGSPALNSSTSVLIDMGPTVTASSSGSAKTFTAVSTSSKVVIINNATFTANARANVGVTLNLNATLVAQLNTLLGLSI